LAVEALKLAQISLSEP